MSAQPEALRLADELEQFRNDATPGKWGKGVTTHETVATQADGSKYHVADFRHAADAAFVDMAHRQARGIAAELRRLHARIEVLEHYRKVYGLVSGILAYTAEVCPIEPGDEITVRRLKMLVADLHTYVQRCQAKDALLRQALEALETDDWQKKLQAAIDIRQHMEGKA